MIRPSGLTAFYDWHAYWVAARMRADEIEQYVALVSGGEPYDHEIAARAFIAMPGPRFTLMGGEPTMPVMIGGFSEIMPGVWHSWMAATEDAWTGHWRAITKASLWLRDELAKQGGRRFQTMCLASRGKTREWYERALKLRLEGIHEAMGAHGEDVAHYAITGGQHHGIV